jgi:AcrR family transcriptional regulator
MTVAKGTRKKKAIRRRRTRNSLNRIEILEAARDLLAEEGVDALSMRAIAKRLQCSVGSPYVHFSNQEEILRELFLLEERPLTARLRLARRESGDVLVQLSIFARIYWDFAETHRELHKAMFNLFAGKLYRNVFPYLTASYRLFLITVREGIRRGSIPYPPHMYMPLARTMWAWLHGLIVLNMEGVIDAGEVSPVGENHPLNEGLRLFQLWLSQKPEGPAATCLESFSPRGK